MLRTVLAFGVIPVLLSVPALSQTPPTQETCLPASSNGQGQTVSWGWETDKCDCTSKAFAITGWPSANCNSSSRCKWRISVDWSGCMQAEKRSCIQVSHPDCCPASGVGDWWAWSRTEDTLTTQSDFYYRQCVAGTVSKTFQAPCPADQGQGPSRDAWNCDEPIEAGDFDIVSYDLECVPCDS